MDNSSTIPTVHKFLSRHVPEQMTNSRKICYRHRADLVRNRMPESPSFQEVQQQMETLTEEDQEAITHIWSIFSAAPAEQRILILKGLLTTCCMPQLSYLYNTVRPLLRIDFMSVFPREIALRIFSFLDAKSLCHAAQVSRLWKDLADDDALWHHMCEQHIDKKCTKCGWGLPLLDKKRSAAIRKRPMTESPIRTPCGSNGDTTSRTSGESPPLRPVSEKKRKTTDSSDGTMVETFEAEPTDCTSSQTTSAALRRPWKDVYSERLIVERNWRNNNYKLRSLSGHTDGVMCVQICDALNVLMTGSYDKTVRVWKLDTGEEVRTLKGHMRCVRALQFDDAKLVTGALDNTLKIWNWKTGQCIRTLEGHTDGVLSLHFDCRLLVSGSKDRSIRVWNFSAGECRTLQGHTDMVNSVRITPDSKMIVSASDDTTVRIWDLATWSCLRVLQGHVGQVQSALPSPLGFTHHFESSLPALPAVSQTRATSSTMATTTSAAMNPPGCTISNGRARGSARDETPTSTTTTALLSDTPVVLSGSLDNTIKLWDMESGQCLRTLFGHVEGVWGLAYDKLRIVSGSHDKTVRVWDTESGRCIHSLVGHHGPVTAVALTDTKVVSVSDDGGVNIWDYSKQ